MEFKRINRVFLVASFAVTTLVLAFTLSWIVLAQQNFIYKVWHDIGGIGEGIDKFGPRNRYKPGFGDTTPEQRADLFSQINSSVHDSGKGLEEIYYETHSSGGRQILLREAEVVHLQDVANLIDFLTWAVATNFIVWLILAGLIFRYPYRLLSYKAQFGGVLGFVAFATLGVFIIGPVKVFNQLHIMIFPKDNKWFFYYQDSLMSTLMMAPNLFGWIAGALILLAVAMFCFLLIAVKKTEIKLKQDHK